MLVNYEGTYNGKNVEPRALQHAHLPEAEAICAMHPHTCTHAPTASTMHPRTLSHTSISLASSH